MSLVRFNRVAGRPQVFRSIYVLPQQASRLNSGRQEFPDTSVFLNTADPVTDFGLIEVLKSDLARTDSIYLSHFGVDLPSEAQILGLSFRVIGLISNGTDTAGSVDDWNIELTPFLNLSQQGGRHQFALSEGAFSTPADFDDSTTPSALSVDTSLFFVGGTNQLANTLVFPNGVFGSDVTNGNLSIEFYLISSAVFAGGDTNLRIASVWTSFYFLTERDGANRFQSNARNRTYYDMNDDIAEHVPEGPWFK